MSDEAKKKLSSPATLSNVKRGADRGISHTNYIAEGRTILIINTSFSVFKNAIAV
jgi:hypothetical protein